MQGNVGVYAVKRRKKPTQKNAAPPPVKTNPSKRHRDRLNVELERLTSLLPFSEDVRNRLDKLSVLRLSVGYLKVKSYFHTHRRNGTPLPPPDGRTQSVSQDGVGFSEGELLLKSLNGFVLVVTGDGTIFYTSPTVQDYLGFHQSDVVQHSVFDLIHIDDREMFNCQLKLGVHLSETGADATVKAAKSSSNSLLPPENSFFLERNFCCRLRCLLDNTSGFLALKFSSHLKYLRDDAGPEGNPLLALFAIATPIQPPPVMEIRTRTLIFQTKHRMDFAPMAVDTRGKLVLGYSETELITPRSGYQFVHAADMMYCADNHLKMIKTGDSGFTFFRLLTKTGQWLWVQATARVVFKDGRPDFIIARQKPLTNEEGEEHLQQRRQQLPFNLATGEGVLYDLSLDAFTIPGPAGTEEPPAKNHLDPSSILGSLHRQDRSLYSQKPVTQVPVFSRIDETDLDQPLERAFSDSHALLSVPGQLEETPGSGGFTAHPMLDSLEQILGDLAEASLDGLEVEQRELRDWENTLVRMNQDRELDQILANDIFSYVEEALGMKTSGGERSLLASPDSSRPFDYGQEVLPGILFSGVAPSPNAHVGHWPASSGPHHQGIPTRSCSFETTWPPSMLTSNTELQWAHSNPSQQAAWPHPHVDAKGPQLYGSCMYEQLANSGPPVPQRPPFSGQVHFEAPNTGFAPPHVVRPSASTIGQTQPPAFGDMSEADVSRPKRAPENGALESTFFCWNGQAQMPKVALNPYDFPVHPPGSLNISQNTGP
ncbi:aryl hydrocarbon receptor-like [Phyllopteryx taeniolatus]|uniref:aryl hydrocarbon receptor-like n=1 Tax=Phyllopteryx taeniolatus TaxID=161469 RepID=UPI002AD20151|nr:aryl hydrocarbon receptor-like [Phyllopteryx taeniolatus]XP_061603741.1 aryl hydrocarbon receptor-like [Phyllopteryx taeniolatus]XP_061603742.1 aryl hydrocarbon receptor-like [Phyllopteryx taeniolatus]